MSGSLTNYPEVTGDILQGTSGSLQCWHSFVSNPLDHGILRFTKRCYHLQGLIAGHGRIAAVAVLGVVRLSIATL